MKVDYVEEGLCRRHLDVELPAEEVTEAFERHADRLRRQLRLPGFRKGKIPKELVKTRYRDELLSRVAEDLVPEAVRRAIRERELEPIGEPEVGRISVELGAPLRFRASFEVLPRLEVKNYKGIEVEAPSAAVSEAEIDERLERLREQAASFAPVEDRGARDGDFVHLDIEETPADGKGATRRQENVVLQVGTDVYHPSLHEKLQGVRPGEAIELRVAFPPDHPDRSRAGRSFDLRAVVRELKEKVLPELDDELAKDLGEWTTLEELREHVRREAEEEAKQKAEHTLRQRLLEKLLEANPFEPPATLVEMELDRRIEEMARSILDRGIDPRTAGVDWRELRESMRGSASRSVAATILLDRIAEQEGLRESEEEIDRHLDAIAAQWKRSREATRAQMLKDGALETLRRRLRRDKAVDLIRETARIQGG